MGVAPEMSWTTLPPKKPGWYWARKTGCYPVVVNLIGSGVMTANSYEPGIMIWRGDGSFADPYTYDEWWPIPIPEPAEQNESTLGEPVPADPLAQPQTPVSTKGDDKND